MAEVTKSAPEALREEIEDLLESFRGAHTGWINAPTLKALRAAHERPGAYGDEDDARQAAIARDLLAEHGEHGECLTLMVGRLAADASESPVCRLQLPDGTVPTGNADAAESWHKVASGYFGQINELRTQLEAAVANQADPDSLPNTARELLQWVSDTVWLSAENEAALATKLGNLLASECVSASREVAKERDDLRAQLEKVRATDECKRKEIKALHRAKAGLRTELRKHREPGHEDFVLVHSNEIRRLRQISSRSAGVRRDYADLVNENARLRTRLDERDSGSTQRLTIETLGGTTLRPTLADAVRQAGLDLVVMEKPALHNDACGRPEPDAKAVVLSRDRVAATANDWGLAYDVAHEIAESQYGFRHCDDMFAHQANILAAWCRLLAGATSDPVLEASAKARSGVVDPLEDARKALAEAGVECETVAGGIRILEYGRNCAQHAASISDEAASGWARHAAEISARKAEAAGGVGLLRRLREWAGNLPMVLFHGGEWHCRRGFVIDEIDRLIAEAEAQPAEEPEHPETLRLLNVPDNLRDDLLQLRQAKWGSEEWFGAVDWILHEVCEHAALARRRCNHRSPGECDISCYGPDTRGLYGKFRVERVDGRDKPGEKHAGCDYFVLDLTHDKHALPAIRAYARDCKAERPQLSADLMAKYGAAEESEQHQGVGEEQGCPTRTQVASAEGRAPVATSPTPPSQPRREPQEGDDVLREWLEQREERLKLAGCRGGAPVLDALAELVRRALDGEAPRPS